MYKHTTLPNESYEYDRIMSQPTEGLIEQQLTTTYRNKEGEIFQHTVTRRFTNKDYNDSSTSKFIG